MAIKVPTLSTSNSQPQSLPNVRQQGGRNAADFINPTQAAALEAANDGLQSIQKAAFALHAKALDDNNRLITKEAGNEIDIYDQDSAYGKGDQTGWINQTGKAALKQDNGKFLSDNVLESRQQKIDEIKQRLGNDDQRQMFQDYADRTGVRIREHLKSHERVQNSNYQQGVLIASIDTKARDMALNYNDEAAIGDGITRIMEDSLSFGRLKYGSEEAGIAYGRKQVSESLKQSIQSALQHGDHVTAMKIQDRFGTHLDPDDRNSMQDKIADNWAAGKLAENPEEVTRLLGTDRLKNAILQQESGGRDLDSKGNPLVSSDGKSMFAMQVTHETAAKPGFGIAPAKDRTAAEYNRVGSELLEKLRHRYQDDPAKVAAAYNAGAGAVDAAIEKGGDDWMQHIPASTRDVYVPNVLRNLKTDTPVDIMSAQDRRKWLNAAQSQIEHGRNVYAVELKQAVDDQYSQAAHTGQSGSLIPASDFQRAFGDKWESTYKDYRDNMDFASTYFGVKTMPSNQAAKLLTDSRPQPGTPNFEHEQKQYELLSKAIDAADTERKSDPISWAIQNGYNAKPINWQNNREAQQEIVKRNSIAQQLSEQYSAPFTVLTKDESSQLTLLLSNGAEDDKINTLKTLADGINEPQAYAMTLQKIRPDSPATLVAGSLIGMDRIQKASGMLGDSITAIRGEDVARTILRGEALLNPSKAQKEHDGKSTGVSLPTRLNESIYSLMGDAVAGDPETEQGIVSAVRAYYAAKMDKSKADGGLVQETLLNEAVQSITGGIAEHADRKVIMPFGMNETEFLDQAEAKLRQQLGDKAVPICAITHDLPKNR